MKPKQSKIVIRGKVSCNLFTWKGLACDQAIQSALAARQEKEAGKETLQLRLWNLNSTSTSPVAPQQLSCQIVANQREVEQARM